MEEENTLLEFGFKRADEERRDGGCGVVFDPTSQKYAVGRQSQDGLYRLFSGGVDQAELIEVGVQREVTEESGLYDFLLMEKIAQAITHYHNNLRKVNRVGRATCFLFILNSTRTIPTELETHEKFNLIWVTADEILANWQQRNEQKDYDHWIYFLKKAVVRAQELGYDKTSAQCGTFPVATE